jgi:hypothetical protein
MSDKTGNDERDRGADTTTGGGLGRLLRRLGGRRERQGPAVPVHDDGGEAGAVAASARELPREAVAGLDETGAYGDLQEHLADELRILDLRIHLLLSEQRRRRPENPWEQLKGLIVSEEEIAALVSTPTDRPDGRGGEEPPARRRLTAALSRLVAHAAKRRAASREEDVVLTLPHLAQLFQLSPVEEQTLVVCLAPEIDRKYDKLYAYLQDDVTRKRPSVDLALSLAGLSWRERLAARAVFDSQAPLVRYRLLQVLDRAPEGPQPLLARSLKLDDRIAELLLGSQRIDARLESGARLVGAAEAARPADLPPPLASRMRGFLRSCFVEAPSGRVVFHVRGPYGVGKQALVALAAAELGLPLLIGDAQRLAGADELWLLARESFLQPAVLCLESFDALLAGGRAADLRQWLAATQSLSQLTFLLGEQPWQPRDLLRDATFVVLDLAMPDDGARARLWSSQLGGEELADEVDPGSLAGMFRFTPGQVLDAFNAARDLARWRSPGPARVARQDLYAACRAQATPELARLARKIELRHGWADIVLPADPVAQLREICDQARYRHVVLGDWGFDRKLSYGKGLAALFSGPPGTGKTMAAEVVAGELGLDLYKIDLSQVVSKYIGETEKNLDRIFNAAEHAHAILFFDEADALFGKRSEVRDSHDRYANVEISYLLQKMEEYEGISILATNLRQHMDDAFVRRLQSIVEFPFPDAEDRERIWRVTFPGATPVGEDVDFAALGRGLRLAGGNIKNIGLLAAFYAAADGGVVRMPHLLRAARREHQKLGRTWNEQQMAAGLGAPAAVAGGTAS